MRPFFPTSVTYMYGMFLCRICIFIQVSGGTVLTDDVRDSTPMLQRLNSRIDALLKRKLRRNTFKIFRT